ncbi:amidohydrolase [Sulfidibacter corallicola]|nr:amidohydrolase [Sulfidibacter corallicola]
MVDPFVAVSRRSLRGIRFCVVSTLFLSLFAMTSNVRAADASELDGTADLVLRNGRIYTVDKSQPWVEALAVKDGIIVARGSEADLKKWIGDGTRTLDLEGGFAMPGFIEGHAHLLGMGEARLNLWLADTRSWDEIVARVKDAAAKAAPGDWITGRGWHQEKWDAQPAKIVKGFPTHEALSKVAPNNPVVLEHASGHALIANAKAMEVANIGSDVKDPQGGEVFRDAKGNLTGIFNEAAESLIYRALERHRSTLSEGARNSRTRKALRLAMQECLAKGVTSFQDAGSSFEMIEAYKALAGEQKLGIRLWVMVNAGIDDLRENLHRYRKLKRYGNGYLTLGGIKAYADGALGSRGAWLLKPYADMPGQLGQNVTTVAELEQLAEIALAHELQLCVHAIGDRANREVLDVYKRALEGRDKRWRIEHAQHLHPDDIPRFAELKIIASMQGVHCTSDAPFVEKRLGHDRASQGAYAWQALWRAGVVVSNGTDAPVEDVSPLASLFSTVTRQLADGSVFFPKHKLDMDQAIRSYTINPAYAAFEEDIKGSLEVGKLADIVVLSKNLMDVDPVRIRDAEVVYTIVNGDIRYRKP